MGIDPRRKRLLAIGAVAIAVAAAAGVAVAGGGGNTTQGSRAARSATGNGGFNEDFHAALQALVDESTISQAQANVIREQGDNGSIDPLVLVRDGVVSAAQMRAVANRLDRAKRDTAIRLGDRAATTTPSPVAPKD